MLDASVAVVDPGEVAHRAVAQRARESAADDVDAVLLRQFGEQSIDRARMRRHRLHRLHSIQPPRPDR